ncbi:MAG: DUF72 domain-containing protein [Sulfolobaceae archaeon]
MIYIGTSGWLYSWNPKRNLDWYIKYSGFNAVELNASFYRIPTSLQVKKWSKYNNIKWAIKVNKKITHLKKLKNIEKDLDEFIELFKPINPKFFLFQLPPNFKFNEENLNRVRDLASILGVKMAVEFRDREWYLNLPKLDCVVVSIDSPIGSFYVNSNDIIYLRMHGRDNWYFYEYSNEELRNIAINIINLKPKEVYVFFNNDLWMLNNGREMIKIFKELGF